VSAELDASAKTIALSFDITPGFQPTAAHIHGPAVAGVNAGVLVPINASVLDGVFAVTEEQIADPLNGKTYVNLHSTGEILLACRLTVARKYRGLVAAYPGGEIRAQLLFASNGIAVMSSAQVNNGTNAASALLGIATVLVTSDTTYNISVKVSDGEGGAFGSAFQNETSLPGSVHRDCYPRAFRFHWHQRPDCE